mgnify:CR=1 FL=1
MRKEILSAALVSWALVLPASADLLDGDNWQHESLVSQPPNYIVQLPPWYTGTPDLSLDSPITPFPAASGFLGTVRSEVYYLNGVDASGGVGFAYRFIIDPAYAFDGLESASFDAAGWAGLNIFDFGADDSGSSTSLPVPGNPPPGFTTWTHGSPYTIRRDANTSAPELRWSGALGGTTIEGGGSSAIIWFETDATSVGTSIVTLLDGGSSGSAFVLVPEPMSGLLMLAGVLGLALRRRR